MELKSILDDHREWTISNKQRGKRANLEGAYLYGTSIKAFQFGKHFSFYHEGYLRIGCKGKNIEEWLIEFESIGIQEKYSPLEIKQYGAMIKLLKEFESWS